MPAFRQVEDGQFAMEVLEHINKRINEFKEEDGNLYAIYGTPAENQIDAFIKAHVHSAPD